MTKSTVTWTDEAESAAAGAELGRKIKADLGGAVPDAVIVFISPRYDVPALLASLKAACGAKVLMGCSSAGEFAAGESTTGRASAAAIVSSEMTFSCGIGRGLSQSRVAVAESMCRDFKGVSRAQSAYKSALVLTDALAGHADELIDELTVRTGGNYQFFGGGAGDDDRFSNTQVYCGEEVASDAAVALEIISTKPIGVGVKHGWRPAGAPMRVTESEGGRVISLNSTLASEVFAEHAVKTGQKFDPKAPIPFFLHNILGIDTGAGFKLRVPLAVNSDGSVSCAAEVPTGATVCVMQTDPTSASEAATTATRSAIDQLNGNKPHLALFFDCVATRLRLGQEFGAELEAVGRVLGAARFAGCNTYGQVARAEGQFSGFHNCTAVVCVFPE